MDRKMEKGFCVHHFQKPKHAKVFFVTKNRTKQRIEEKRDDKLRKDTKNQLDYVFWDQNVNIKEKVLKK